MIKLQVKSRWMMPFNGVLVKTQVMMFIEKDLQDISAKNMFQVRLLKYVGCV